MAIGEAIALQRSLLRQRLHHRLRMLLLLSAGRTAHGVHGAPPKMQRENGGWMRCKGGIWQRVGMFGTNRCWMMLVRTVRCWWRMPFKFWMKPILINSHKWWSGSSDLALLQSLGVSTSTWFFPKLFHSSGFSYIDPQHYISLVCH